LQISQKQERPGSKGSNELSVSFPYHPGRLTT